MNKGLKIVAIIVGALAAIVIIAGIILSKLMPKPSTPAPVSTSAPATSAPIIEEPVEDEVVSLPQMLLETAEASHIEETTYTLDNGTLTVTGQINNFWDEDDCVRMVATFTAKVISFCFKDENVNEVITDCQAEMVDLKGNSHIRTAVAVKFTRTNASDINFDKYIDMVTLDYNTMIKTADVFYINPNIASELKKLTEKVSTVNPASGEESTESVSDPEEVRNMLETVLTASHPDSSVSYDKDLDCFIINMSEDGIAQTVVAAQTSDELKETWGEVRTAMCEVCTSTKDVVKSAGLNSAVMVNVLNDLDRDKTLLTIVDGVIVYDSVGE